MPAALLFPLFVLAIIGVAFLLVVLADVLRVACVKRHEGAERWMAEHPSKEPSQDVTAQTHG